MDWLKKNYDLALLGLAALLVASSALVIYSSGQESTVNTVAPPVPKAIPSATPDFAAIEAAKTLLSSTPAIASSPLKTSPFVSRSYLLKDGKLFDPIEGKEDLHPPLTNAWIIANELDYSDIGIKERDPDGDGFSNLEEFDGRTDPNDPVSSPPLSTKLRLVEFTPIPFRIEFKGDPTGQGKEFQINLRDLKGSSRTQYKKEGDIIEAGPDRPPYKILSYLFKEEPNLRGVLTDISELTIQNTSTEEKIVLVYNVERNDPSSEAIFRNELDGREFKLKKGQEFTIPPDEQTRFKIVDITETSAEIKELQSGSLSKVRRLETSPPAAP